MHTNASRSVTYEGLRELVTLRSERVQIPHPTDRVRLQFAIRSRDAPSVTCIARSIAETTSRACGGRDSRAWPCFTRQWRRCCPNLGDLPFATIADSEKQLSADFGVESKLCTVRISRMRGEQRSMVPSPSARRNRRGKGVSGCPPTS
jgi:hypothetical protein